MVKRSLAQDRESSPARTDVLTTMLRHELQIGTDMLRIITSTGDELLKNVNIDDFE